MKKIISKGLIVIFAIGILSTAVVAVWFQAIQVRREFRKTAVDNFWQIENIVENNNAKLAVIKEEFSENCIIRARAAAYIAQNYPEVIEDIEECKLVASLLQVDELHFFTPEGEIYAGTNPEYYGLNFSSGEQMAFFQSMLVDYTEELCQDITPNTAEEKLMQYAAVWTADHKNIVQVGLEPERVLQAIEGNNISDIFYMLSADTSAYFYAIDAESGDVVGSTVDNLVGHNMKEMEFSLKETMGTIPEEAPVFKDVVFENENYYCAVKASGDLYFIMMRSLGDLYRSIQWNTLVFTLCMMLLFLAVVISVFLFLDKNIIKSILRVNGDLKRIEQGHWDTVLCENSLPEFAQLSGYINSMVGSIVDFPEKLSKALELSEVPIAICEYVPETKMITVTSRVKDILQIREEELEALLEQPEHFATLLKELFQPGNRYDNNIYCLGESENRFVKMESFPYKNSNIIILIDVTAEITEKERLSEERDTDALTGLHNRRAFRRQVKALMEEKAYGTRAAMVLMDLDNLKRVNDIHGHLAGDKYICTMAETLAAGIEKGQIAARLGGDEFVLFLYDSEEADIEEALERLRSNRGQKKVVLENGEVMTLEFSMGVAWYPEEVPDYRHLVSLADERMYAEKLQRKQGAKR